MKDYEPGYEMMEIEGGSDRYFDRLDVEAAIDNCNFNKALGTD